MNRSEMIDRLLSRGDPWDMVIIGGGATGAAIALDAASRGHGTLLLEQHDFGKGTSSRSTKLVHGGVRYLQQGNISLVTEALRERGLLRKNAPHLVRCLPFVVPGYKWWEKPFYGTGLKLYNLLSGRRSFGPSRLLSRKEVLSLLPGINPDGLRGGAVYYDGQFDDTRLLIDMLRTAVEHGAVVLNYAGAAGFERDGTGRIRGVVALDSESGREMQIPSRVVINATGVFCDSVRRLSDPQAAPMVAPSQGTHLVLPKSFLIGDAAILVPRTPDGRVMFAIPWQGHTLTGTTDEPATEIPLEPRPFEQEVDLILETAGRYLSRHPARADVLSAFAGIRPLVRSGDPRSTSELSRDHLIHTDDSGLVTITGGKWTTCRNMAEDCVDRASNMAGLEKRPCLTRSLRIHGYHTSAEEFGRYEAYGSDAPMLREMEMNGLAEPLDRELPYTHTEVIWAVRFEMARTVEDVLARRTRALFLNARAAVRMAPQTARLMAAELGRDGHWVSEQVEAFTRLAERYLVTPAVGGHSSRNSNPIPDIR